jgi:hypothetical protein
MSGGPAGYREVEHLGREDECGSQAKKGCLARFERAFHVTHGQSYSDSGGARCEQDGFAIEESVWQMHVMFVSAVNLARDLTAFAWMLRSPNEVLRR